MEDAVNMIFAIGQAKLEREEVTSPGRNDLIVMEEFSNIRIYVDGKPLAEGNMATIAEPIIYHLNHFLFPTSPETASLGIGMIYKSPIGKEKKCIMIKEVY